MKLLRSSKQIAESLKHSPPNQIAVAYLGLNWDTYIDRKSIDSIVLSPTIGTNPNAVATLVEAIGWEKVHFLPQLHSKIYISDNQIILGSANLSNNGLGSNGQYELCASSDDNAIIREAKELYGSYLDKSKKLYDSKEAKIYALDKLWVQYNARIAAGREIAPDAIRAFADYKPDLHGSFYIMWYGYVDGNIAYENIPEVVIDEIVSEVHISPEDNIEPEKWILYWRRNNNNTVNQATNIVWMYIHEIYPGGCDEEGYENLGVQRRSKPLPDEPFEITNAFQRNFSNMIASNNHNEFRDPQEGDPWLVRNTFNTFTPFIKKLQRMCNDN